MLDAMSYMIVRSAISPGMEQAFDGITYIECEQENLNLQAAMSSLLATRVAESPFCLYKTTQPPYVVLNRLLSRVGYKVVTANSITMNGHWQIWTLCNSIN